MGLTILNWSSSVIKNQILKGFCKISTVWHLHTNIPAYLKASCQFVLLDYV